MSRMISGRTVATLLRAGFNRLAWMGMVFAFLGGPLLVRASDAQPVPELPPRKPAASRAVESQPDSPGVPDYARMTGFVPHAALPTRRPEVLWFFLSTHDDRMIGLGDPVVADGVVYVGDVLGRLYAMRAEDGAEIWQQHVGGSRIAATPAVDGERVYVGTEMGVSAVSRETGRPLWVIAVACGGEEATPIPVGERVYFSACNGRAYAADRQAGRIIWQHDFLEDAPPDQPGFPGKQARLQRTVARPRGSACDGELFIQNVFDQSRTIALDCATGERRWTFQTGGWVEAAPTIAGDRVYIASQDKYLYCVDHDTGQLLWKFQAPTSLTSRPAVHQGKVYLPCHNSRLYELDAETGGELRLFEPPNGEGLGSNVDCFPIVTEHYVYFASGGHGQIYAIDIESGEIAWELGPAEDSALFTNPATDGRRLFVTSRQKDENTGVSAVLAIGR